MGDLWLPGFARVDLDGQPHGGPYDDMSRPKFGWHTWEGMSWSGAEAAFRKYPPHVAVFPPWPGQEAKVGRRQYVSLDRHAYAFAGSENDDEYVVQVEVAGFAKDMRHAPEVVLRWLATEVVAPIERAVGVPRVVVRFGFRDSGFLATPRSAIRLTAAELRQFSGHLGHQHMPAPDAHWDPGALPIDRILNYLDDHTEDDDMESQFLLGLYAGYFGAQPGDKKSDGKPVIDPPGFNFWLKALLDGTPRETVRVSFAKAAGL